jgi:predicted ribosome quality control (RQC) complex YloA/Tae2 family protein
MAKKSIAGVELTALVNELQFLVKGKVSQIYHQDKKELVLQLHAPGQGKRLLKIVPGKFLCLTDLKNPPLRPSGFCMQLRKYLSNAFIKKIYQKDAERIVIFELEKKGPYVMILELFSKGNIILTDEKYNIIGTLERQIWKDRVVKNKEKYVFPEPQVNWKEINITKFSSIISKSDRKNLATSLATELNLGGVYAEEICRLAGVDKDILPLYVAKGDLKKLFESLQKIQKKLFESQGYFYETEITPFALTNMKEVTKSKTYNEAINTLNPFQITSPYEKRISSLKNRVSQQEEAIMKLEKDIEKNTKKGEIIYENYALLQQLREIVVTMRTKLSWVEIGKELKKQKKITQVDLKLKKVVIDF